MSLNIEQLTTPLTREQVKTRIYATMGTLGLAITSWQEGAVVRTIIAILATIFAAFSRVSAEAVKSQFLDFATASWLTALAYYVYGVIRTEATFAPGFVTFDNSGGGSFDFDVGEYVCKNTATGKTYQNAEAFTIDPFQTGVTVAIEAIEAGSASNASPGAIDDHVTTMLEVTVTNALAVVGVDEEIDEKLRERCRLSLGALSPNGPGAAYEYVARTPSLVGGAVVTRVKVMPAEGDGTVTVLIAGPSGAMSGGDVTLVDTGIQTWAVPDSATTLVESATNSTLDVEYELWISSKAGLTTGEVETLAAAKLTSYFPDIPIGGYEIPPDGGKVFFRALEGQLESISPYVLHAKLVPETDLDLADEEVAVLGTVTATVHVVSA